MLLQNKEGHWKHSDWKSSDMWNFNIVGTQSSLDGEFIKNNNVKRQQEYEK